MNVLSHRFCNPRPTGREALSLGLGEAFTLLELVGVLGILAILAALAAPSILRQVDRANTTKEVSDLATFADALKRSILRSKTIPAASGLALAIASEAALPLAQITTNGCGNQRAFLVDPTCNLGAGLPYTQSGNAGLANPPTNPRLLLISSLSALNPLHGTELASTVANFTDIWNTPEKAKPAGWNGWAGTADDLRVERINLGPLFRRIILVNHDPANAPRFAIDNSGVLSDAPTNGVWEAYYLDGTVLSLCVGTNLQTRQVLTSDISFVFESAAWRATIGTGAIAAGLPDAFSLSAKQFLAAAWNVGAQQQGASQAPILMAMCSFMLEYSTWANGCPHFAYHGTPSYVQVPEYRLIDSLGQRNGFLDQFSGSGGLLK